VSWTKWCRHFVVSCHLCPSNKKVSCNTKGISDSTVRSFYPLHYNTFFVQYDHNFFDIVVIFTLSLPLLVGPRAISRKRRILFGPFPFSAAHGPFTPLHPIIHLALKSFLSFSEILNGNQTPVTQDGAPAPSSLLLRQLHSSHL
jgi:hypothetical protein